MKKLLMLSTLMIASAVHAEGVNIGGVSTTWRALGSNDTVQVDRFDDPKVSGASCYVSYAKTGGVSGFIGVATDPSRFSIACRATGHVQITGSIDRTKKGEIAFSRSTSILFKDMNITRFYDEQKNMLIYLVWSTKLINGSPYNSISAIPVM